MTSLFLARRRAEEFAVAVDGDPGSSSAHRSEINQLAGVAYALREHTAVVPRPAFTADLRERLLLEAESALRPAEPTLLLPERPRGVCERRLVAAASAFVLIGGTASVAAAAQGSLPGEVLYPVKRGLEQAEAGLSVSTAGKGYDLLSQANHRLAEVEGLLVADPTQGQPRVSETLRDFTAQAAEGSGLLFDSYRETRDPADIATVRSFAADGMDALEQLSEKVPSDAHDDLTAAALLLRDLDREAAVLCGGCATDLPSLDAPGVFLASAEVDRALILARTASLTNSHPVVVPPTLQGAVAQDKPRKPESGGDGSAEPAPQPTPTTPGPTTPTEAPTAVPSLDVGPQNLPSLLPQKTEQAAGDSDKKSPGKAVKDLTDGLGGAVQTLLPDTGDLLP